MEHHTTLFELIPGLGTLPVHVIAAVFVCLIIWTLAAVFYFEVKNDNIIARRLSSIDEMRGIVKTNKILSKIEYKKRVKKAVLQKFRKRQVLENIQP